MDEPLELSLVSTSYRPKTTTSEAAKPVKTSKEPGSSEVPVSPEEALQILRQQPDYESLLSVLGFLGQDLPDPGGFSITRPGPQSALITQVLVSEVAPNYWTLLKEDSDLKESDQKNGLSGSQLFTKCLRSIAGINALLAHIRALILEAKSERRADKLKSHVSLNIHVALDLLCSILQQDGALEDILRSTTACVENGTKGKPLSQEMLGVFGGGRLLSTATEAEHIAQQAGSEYQSRQFWIADARGYISWLGDSIATAMAGSPSEEDTKFFSALLFKSLSLGNSDAFIKLLLRQLLLQRGSRPESFRLLVEKMLPTEQRKILFAALKFLSGSYLDRFGRCESARSTKLIASAAAAIYALIGESKTGQEHLVTWLTSSSGAGIGEGIGIRRAVMAVIGQDKEILTMVLEKSISQFGDQLYIKHSPILQQEAHAQVLLLAAGYSLRLTPSILSMQMRSSPWLNTVSNRLSATHYRARFLGMVVGEALSALVDKPDTKLDFHMDETSSQEARWYKTLTRTVDQIGAVASIYELEPERTTPQNGTIPPRASKTKRASQAAKRTAPQPPTPGFIIEEVDDLDGDDDLVPYKKPDDDAEDSDDDPTLIQRNKPQPPVYIRDLIRYLRDTESYEHQKLALTTAPILIRRKANFGTEVAEHAEELATLLIGLQDKFDLEGFDDLRVQGMLAIVVAQPQTMGIWFSKTFFDGDYSMSQRAAILIVIGLGAREIAGIESSGFVQEALFPSNSLPQHIERLYAGPPIPESQARSSHLKPLPPNALDNIASSLTSSFMAPLVASAADKATGPDALKLSTFSSHLDASKIKYKSKLKPQARARTIPNTSAQLISSSLFAPLTARFQAAVHSSISRARGIIFQSQLLSLYLKTLGILIHAAGPSTLALPHMTAELWAVLLSSSVRTHCLGDLTITRAGLFALLALLEVNEDRMREICQDMSKEVVETQEWVATVFGNIRGGDGEGGEENEAKGLAAAVLVRLKEGIDKYQLLLAGDLIG